MATSIDQERDAEKRKVRAAIGRSRRRIDRRLRATNEAAVSLASWKTYVRRWPGLALAAGLGAGWIVAAGLRPRFLVGLLGARFMREMSTRATNLLTGELKSFWADAAPQRSAGEAEGGDDA